MKCDICNTGTMRVRLDEQSLCMACYNAMMAAELDIELPEIPGTFAVEDATGAQRIFEVERQIMHTAILLTARERWENGYEFAVDGELDADQHGLFKQLKEKTTRGLAETYLETSNFSMQQPQAYVKQRHLQGVLAYDSTKSEAPLVIIDGKPYTWDEVGRLLQTFEGFQVKMVMKELAGEFE